MHLKVLGCNGGVGGITRRTVCYRINQSILIDAGTGVGDLSLEELAKIDHVVLTHAHWDHISCLPLLPDAIFTERKSPIKVWALPEVIDLLATHVFNNRIWPDFTKIPMVGSSNAIIELKPLPKKDPITINGVIFSKLPASHGIPACGFKVQQNRVSLAFSGDSADNDAFWNLISTDKTIRAVIVECSYPKSMTKLGVMTCHLSTDVLGSRLLKLSNEVKQIIIHRKPGYEEIIVAELMGVTGGSGLCFPIPGEEYEF